MKLRLLSVATLTTLVSITACAAPPIGDEGDEPQDEGVASSHDGLVTASFVARGTGYYPDSSPLEGGFVDRRGARLRTLQQFLAGQADYVSVAMDVNAFPYGQHLRIRELEAKYGRAIDFRVVDTGGAFRGKGRSRVDVCVANRTASLDATINGTLNIDALDRASTATGATPPPSSSSSSSSAACTNDGACNPGNDGAGLICTAGRCVPGCRTNAQCPGVKRCVSGQCR